MGAGGCLSDAMGTEGEWSVRKTKEKRAGDGGGREAKRKKRKEGKGVRREDEKRRRRKKKKDGHRRGPSESESDDDSGSGGSSSDEMEERKRKKKKKNSKKKTKEKEEKRRGKKKQKWSDPETDDEDDEDSSDGDTEDADSGKQCARETGTKQKSAAAADEDEDIAGGSGDAAATARAAAGLDWMLRAPPSTSAAAAEAAVQKAAAESEGQGTGRGEEKEEETVGLRYPAGAAAAATRRPPPLGVGDGGASWRLKALRRAKEQAEREGKDWKEVVADRWGSVDGLNVGALGGEGRGGRRGAAAAPMYAHKFAARERERAKSGGQDEGRGDLAGEDGEDLESGLTGRGQRRGVFRDGGNDQREAAKGVDGRRGDREEGAEQRERGEEWREERKETDGADGKGRGREREWSLERRWETADKRDERFVGRPWAGARDREGERERKVERGEPRNYLHDVRSERGKMKAPSGHDSLSWRRWRGSGKDGKDGKENTEEGGKHDPLLQKEKAEGGEERESSVLREEVSRVLQGFLPGPTKHRAAAEAEAAGAPGAAAAAAAAAAAVAAVARPGAGAAPATAREDKELRREGDEGRPRQPGSRTEKGRMRSGLPEENDAVDNSRQRNQSGFGDLGSSRGAGAVAAVTAEEAAAVTAVEAAAHGSGGGTMVAEVGDGASRLTANQLAAKAMRLRLMGKHDEAEALLQSAAAKARQQQEQQSSLQKHATQSGEQGQSSMQPQEQQQQQQQQHLSANQIAAKAMRLRLMGKTEEAEALLRQQASQQLRGPLSETARGGGQGGTKESDDGEREDGGGREVVVLPLIDERGRPMPGSGLAGMNTRSEGTRSHEGMRRGKVVERYGVLEGEGRARGDDGGGGGGAEPQIGDGVGDLQGKPAVVPQRVRYYADDDATDLRSLVADARLGRASGGGNYDSNLAHNIARAGGKYKGPTSVDDEYDHDMGLEEYEGRGKQGGRRRQQQQQQQQQQQRAAAVADFKRLQQTEGKCQMCFQNPERPKHLVLSIGTRAYLMLPPWGGLVPGHCLIVAIQHEGSTRTVDEDVWDEMRNFKKCLVRMAASEGQHMLFLETALGMTAGARQRRHCLVEALPVSPALADEAPLYFKKALDEAEDEWSQHHAKRIIDTRGKGLRNCIPPNFPYFHAEFGLQGGYCHVIDDERNFKLNFGRDVIAGMLKEHPQLFGRRESKRTHTADPRQQVAAFLKKWEPYDWTKMLE